MKRLLAIIASPEKARKTIAYEISKTLEHSKAEFKFKIQLFKDHSGWTACTDLEERIGRSKTANDAVNRLADFYEEMAIELRSHKYDNISLEELDSIKDDDDED